MSGRYSEALAAHIVASQPGDLNDADRHEAKRALINIVGCALGGADHPAVDIAIRALGSFAGAADCAVIGRKERVDPLLASLLNGISSHVHDFDDTTPSNYIHPTSPVASALFAYASVNAVSGVDFLNAYVLGYETVTRIGNATYPAHYQRGWHSTGSIGVFGAAVAVGKLMGLDKARMLTAIGLAATQGAGIRDNFGAMAKSFHPGRSAQSGYMAALLAAEGFTAGPRPLEGPRGFAEVTAGEYDLDIVTADLGRDHLLGLNTYKPFPCGIVVHPTIDACLQLRAEHDFAPEDVVAVQLRVAPLVLDLCNQREITRGLEGKFSIYHAAALALVRNRASLAEFSDAAVTDPALAAMRSRVTPVADGSVSEDGVEIELVLSDGRRLHKSLEFSVGNIRKPLSDQQLESKFRDQVRVIGEQQVTGVIERLWAIDTLENVQGLVEATLP
ncbi:MmgE/PrpD family protein [Devosia chinhatensis]|uniref:2-methylcitrate dehydratase n=1 Tax=Devosia chinhatensis TaxID=429727 RepID=A0A0F5FJX5_9HYPH|nr:MmgE/PrpD family protein [Devosia chinhatensis]KKB09141.1 2-methylcitrate dehydratase [Devosia chinhatensis]